jgi:hypothetical protein
MYLSLIITESNVDADFIIEIIIKTLTSLKSAQQLFILSSYAQITRLSECKTLVGKSSLKKSFII